jgi:hydrogenase maturation protein HypF
MLPYTPLHHLLLAELDAPVVATSGNRSDEPICIDEREALERLGGIAQCFLVHNRPIIRPVDDSIVRVMAGRELVLRRARGYAPLPIQIRTASGNTGELPDRPFSPPQMPPRSDLIRPELRESIFAVGAHLNNTVAFGTGNQVFISQHIGDLETTQSFEAFRRAASDLPRLFEAQPARVAADMHPDFLSTRFAQATGLPLTGVQHHYAHVLACMADNLLEPPVLGVCWDGTGYGLDGTIWGGEFLRVTESGFERVAWLRPFPLPGGDRAAREPRRSALGVLYELMGEGAFAQVSLPALQAFSARELAVLGRALERRVNTMRTSSMGRLFDAVASLIGLRQYNRFEGQAAMELEFAAEGGRADGYYEIGLRPAQALGLQTEAAQNTTGIRASPEGTDEASADSVDVWQADWSAAVRAILADVQREVSSADIAAKFHRGLAELALSVARRMGIQQVALTGGCFQNRLLTGQTIERLSASGFSPRWHQRIPPNDGGIALGQVVAVLRGHR